MSPEGPNGARGINKEKIRLGPRQKGHFGVQEFRFLQQGVDIKKQTGDLIALWLYLQLAEQLDCSDFNSETALVPSRRPLTVSIFHL